MSSIEQALAVLGGRIIESPVELEPLGPGETAAVHLTYDDGVTIKVWPRPEEQAATAILAHRRELLAELRNSKRRTKARQKDRNTTLWLFEERG